MASRHTDMKVLVLNHWNSVKLDMGGRAAAEVLQGMQKGSFVTASSCRVDEGVRPLETYVDRLKQAGLPIGRGQQFNYLIGASERYQILRLVVYRRRE